MRSRFLVFVDGEWPEAGMLGPGLIRDVDFVLCYVFVSESVLSADDRSIESVIACVQSVYCSNPPTPLDAHPKIARHTATSDTQGRLAEARAPCSVGRRTHARPHAPADVL